MSKRFGDAVSDCFKARGHLKTLRQLRALPFPQLVDVLWAQLVVANRRFDDRFNAAFDRAMEEVLEVVKEVQRKGLAETWRESSLRRRLSLGGASKPPGRAPVDTGVLVLVGFGLGSGMHGFYVYGISFLIWAVLRSARRFLVICLDTEDAQRLFRFAPAHLQKRKSELFNWMHHELNVMRQIRQGNLHYIGRPGDKDWDIMHDARNDHSPAACRCKHETWSNECV